MGDLQATLELFLELNKFYNVDLFQRGIYQVRCHLRTSPKIAVKVEGTLYRHQNPAGGGGGGGSCRIKTTSSSTGASSGPTILHPACVVNGSLISQTFQILYRNEDVPLSDMAQFRLHVLVDSHKIEEMLERLDIHLVMELWFSDQGYSSSVATPDSPDRLNGNGNGIGCVSTRTLQLHLSPTRGLNYHLPILFDYFHLAAVTLTVHASLIAVHQPYIKRSMKHLVQSCAPRSGRSRMGMNNARTSQSRYDESSFDSFFLPGGTGVKRESGQPGGWRFAQARQVHRDVCSLLSASAESLRQIHRRFLNELPPEDQRRLVEDDPATKEQPLRPSKLDAVPDCEEDFLAAANSEIGRLCAQNVLLWRQLLENFAGSEPVRLLLAQQHHTLRVRRFAEAFYVVRHSKMTMANCNDVDVHTYLYVSEALRKSRYLASLPPLPVECVEMNGDINTIPIIFEDRYQNEPSEPHVVEKKPPDETKADVPSSSSGNNIRASTRPSPQADEFQQPIYEEINPQTPSGTKSLQSAMQLVNHVYRSLPQTPLIGGAASSVLQRQPQECLLGDHRRRSYGGEKGQSQVQVEVSGTSSQSFKEPGSRQQRLYKESGGSLPVPSRLKFRPLVSSKSTENFHHLRRVAMATAGKRNSSLPVKLLGYKALRDISPGPPQSNSESLPDLKWTPNATRRNIRQKQQPTAFTHSMSDPALARALNGLDKRPCPRVEQLQADELASSLSDCSEQSGWVSSTVSSHQSSPIHRPAEAEEPAYPELEPIPLAPPEEFQDPPRTRNFAARFNLGAIINSPRRETLPEGTRGTFRSIGEDEEYANRPNRNKTRPLSQEELRLLQLLLYEMCRPGQPNPLIRALSHSLYESLAVSLSLSPSNGAGQNCKTLEGNVSHSTSLPCLIKNGEGAVPESKPPQPQHQPQAQQPQSTEQRPSLNASIHQRSMSLTMLQPKQEDKADLEGEERLQQKLVSMLGDGTLSFLKAKEDFKRQIHFNGTLYSDIHPINVTSPYFHVPEEMRPFSPEGLHLIVCVHGLDGNSADLRLVKTYLELVLPGANLDFLMSERNQGGTFNTFDAMTDRLVSEILCYLEGNNLNPKRISFVGHSLGTIIIRSALTRPQMRPLLPKLHTFLSLSGPHLGTLYNSSGLVNMGLWLMQRWKKSGSLQQLSLKDAEDPRGSFLYRLARTSELHHFRYVILSASAQDRYVPLHSARIEMCRAAVKDPTSMGAIYQEMVHSILSPLVNNDKVTLVRYDIHHALPSTANALIGRAAHIAVLDSELFIEKFLLVVGSKYFK